MVFFLEQVKDLWEKSGSGGIWEKSTGVPAGETYSDTGSNSRYFDIDHWATRYGLIQIPKASKNEKNEGCEGLETTEKFTAGNYSQSPTCEDCNLTINGTNDHSKCSGEVYYKKMESKNTKNNHPTVKPVHLMAWLVQLISKKGDIVLDPFMGSGTTGVACMQLDRNFIGIEMEEDYIKIAESRIENEGSKPIQMNLFDEIIEPEKKKIEIEKIGLFDEE
jgi:DNA modification methylase